MRPSNELIELLNLCNVARHHKQTCNTPDCNVSIYHMRKTVDRLFLLIERWEHREANEAIRLVDWI